MENATFSPPFAGWGTFSCQGRFDIYMAQRPEVPQSFRAKSAFTAHHELEGGSSLPIMTDTGPLRPRARALRDDQGTESQGQAQDKAVGPGVGAGVGPGNRGVSSKDSSQASSLLLVQPGDSGPCPGTVSIEHGLASSGD